MNKAKLKDLIFTLKDTIEEIESEIYSDTDSYLETINYDIGDITDYDEVFEDDDD